MTNTPGGPAHGDDQPGPVQYAPDHPRATTSLVLGILGLVLCGFVAPFAWVIGRKTLFEIEDSGGRLGGRTAAQAGYILGVIGTVLLVIGVIIVVVYIAGMRALFTSGMASNL
ncbi:MAG TPA: DUF4190 domain-containing protein [Nocardioidaceae bacterium]